jgi:hypothetical protein
MLVACVGSRLSSDKDDTEPLTSAPSYSAWSAHPLRIDYKLKPIRKAPRASGYSKKSTAIRQIVHCAGMSPTPKKLSQRSRHSGGGWCGAHSLA